MCRLIKLMITCVSLTKVLHFQMNQMIYIYISLDAQNPSNFRTRQKHIVPYETARITTFHCVV